MRKSNMYELWILKQNQSNKMDLQRFADPDPEPKETDPKESAQKDSKEPDPKEPKPDDDKKYTDAELDAILEKKFAKWKAQRDKEVDEAKKLEKMNAEEKAKYEKEQLEKKIKEFERREALSGQTKEARKMLSDKGITVPDELLSMLVSDEAETTKANVESFEKVFSAAVEDAVKEKLKGASPKKNTGGATMTKDEIMAIKDSELRQKAMLENRELFDF